MSTITIVNNTSEVVRLAIYKKPVVRPTLASYAWKVIAPPPNGGQTVVQIPAEYGTYANYSFDLAERNDPNAGNRTRIIEFDETTARFIVSSADSQDQPSAATITQVFTGLVLNEVRLENQFGYGVWGHVTKGGDDIYAPQVIWPGGVLMEDVRGGLFLAVVSEFAAKGDRLVAEEASLTETELLEGGTAVVTGSMWEGYAISASLSRSPADPEEDAATEVGDRQADAGTASKSKAGREGSGRKTGDKD